VWQSTFDNKLKSIMTIFENTPTTTSNRITENKQILIYEKDRKTITITWICLERYDLEACKNDSNIFSVISISGGQLNKWRINKLLILKSST